MSKAILEAAGTASRLGVKEQFAFLYPLVESVRDYSNILLQKRAPWAKQSES
jgi:hypothetical protein